MMKHVYGILFLITFSLGSLTLQGQSVRGAMIGISTTDVNDKIIKVYPNPATSIIKLTTSVEKVNYITINNIIGKRIRRVEASTDGRYDVSDLRKGVYIIRIFDGKDELVKALRLSKV